MFAFNAFTKQNVIHAVNHELARAGSKTKAESIKSIYDNVYTFSTTRGALIVAILYYNDLYHMGIRGIHKIKNKQKNFTYLFNGQPGKNLEQIAFNGEMGTFFLAPLNQYKQYLVNVLYKDSPIPEFSINRLLGSYQNLDPVNNKVIKENLGERLYIFEDPQDKIKNEVA